MRYVLLLIVVIWSLRSLDDIAGQAWIDVGFSAKLWVVFAIIAVAIGIIFLFIAYW